MLYNGKRQQTVENHLESTGKATGETECDQVVEIAYDGVDLRNCSANIEQNCTAKAAVTMNSMLEAIQDTNWKGENKQVAKGIAFQVKVLLKVTVLPRRSIK